MKRIHIISLLIAFASCSYAETNSTEAVEEKKERPWLVAPMVVANPSFGNGGGAIGMYFFNTDNTSTNNPDSAIVGIGLYSDTDSYFLGLFAQTFWKEDTWRINGGIANPRIKNDFSLDGLNLPVTPDNVKFTTTVAAYIARVDRRVYGNWFLGVKGQVMDINYSDPNNVAQVYFEVYDVEDSTSGQLGFVGSYDTRNHVRYPTTGNQSEFSWTAAPESWGALSDYSVTEGFSNQYISFVDRQVLALRAYARFTPNGTPYSGLSTLGMFSDLRGYTAGKYVAENLIALQTEYRVMFTKKIGGVAFVGVSQLYNGSLSNTTSDDIYPSGGIGFRYLLNAENKINFRFDYAWGTGDEEGFYMSVGEAF